MRKVLAASAAGLMLAFGLVFTANSAMATTTGAQGSCRTGWYVNPDETADTPEQVGQGFQFEGKDLIHHTTNPIDLADMDKVPATFAATVDGKVVFKVETSTPYSTIITNADGKVWSTAMTYDQEGGQGHPVAKYSDLVGKPTKPGKAQFTDASRVTTFGVGYWVVEGSTIVTSISFHGTKYELSCTPVIATKPTVKPATCDKAGELAKLPEITGVKYETGEIKDGKVTVTATTEDGYKIEGDHEWTLTIPEKLPADSEQCKKPTQSPTPSPTTSSPTPKPTTSNPGNGGGGTQSPTVTPSQSSDAAVPPMDNSGNELPLTGSGKGGLIALVSTGVLMFAVGGILLVLVRRRRDADAVESA